MEEMFIIRALEILSSFSLMTIFFWLFELIRKKNVLTIQCFHFNSNKLIKLMMMIFKKKNEMKSTPLTKMKRKKHLMKFFLS